MLINKSKGLDALVAEEVTDARRLKALFENVDVLLWSVREEPDGQLFYEKVNDVFASVTGRTPLDYEGKPVRDLGTDEEFQSIVNALSAAKKRGVYTYDKRIHTGSGWRQFIIRLICMPTQTGVTYYIGSATDITEQKKTEMELEKEKNRVSEYLNIAGVMLLVIGADQRVTMINRKGCEILGCFEGKIIGKNWFDEFLPVSVREDVRKRFLILMSGGSNPLDYYENPVITTRGEERYILWHSSLLKDENGKVTGLLSSGEDITRRKKVEKELNRHYKTIESLYKLSTEISLASTIDDLLDFTSRFLSDNPGVIAGAIILLNEKTGSLEIHNKFGPKASLFEVSSELRPSNPYFERVLKSPSAVHGVLSIRTFGAQIDANRVGISMKIADKEVGVLCLILKEADEYTVNFLELVAYELGRSIVRKKAEQELYETKQLLEKITYTTPTFISIYDIRTEKILFSNHSLLGELGYPEEEKKHISPLLFKDTEFLYHPDDWQQILKWYDKNLTLKDGEVNEIEYRLKAYNGDWVWFRHLSAVFLRDEKGVPIQSVNAFENISSRKQAETGIKNSLKEKELLLREIHHRVKNNLQVISSLLYLQSKKIKDKNTLSIFLESQSRIRTMVLIHEKLYQSRDLARINYADYIRSLTNSIFQTFTAQLSGIRVEVDVEDIFLDIDSAIGCGLIINELVSNSFKHAFAGGRKGEVKVSLKQYKKGIYSLMISDNGVGFPERIKFNETDSLGLQLVTNLVEQLDGKIELDCSNGTTFKIQFLEKSTDGGEK